MRRASALLDLEDYGEVLDLAVLGHGCGLVADCLSSSRGPAARRAGRAAGRPARKLGQTAGPGYAVRGMGAIPGGDGRRTHASRCPPTRAPQHEVRVSSLVLRRRRQAGSRRARPAPPHALYRAPPPPRPTGGGPPLEV